MLSSTKFIFKDNRDNMCRNEHDLDQCSGSFAKSSNESKMFVCE